MTWHERRTTVISWVGIFVMLLIVFMGIFAGVRIDSKPPCCPAHAAAIQRIMDRHQHLQDDTLDRYDQLSERIQEISDQLAADKARAEERAKSIEADMAKVTEQLKRTQAAVWRLTCPGGVCR